MRPRGANSSNGPQQPKASYALIAASTATRIASPDRKNARSGTAGGTSSRPQSWPTRKTKPDSPLPIQIACLCWRRIGRFLRRSPASASQEELPAPFPFVRRPNLLPNGHLFRNSKKNFVALRAQSLATRQHISQHGVDPSDGFAHLLNGVLATTWSWNVVIGNDLQCVAYMVVQLRNEL